MDRYAIYLRKSRADLELEAKGELETLTRHEKTLLALAKKMKLSIQAIYKEVVSGETIDARPVVQHLLKEVEDGKWTGVLVMEIERLARGDTIDQGIMARAFRLSNTKIITPIKTYDPSNEFDEEYFEFGLFMSRREYKTINRRIQRGRLASVKEGKYIGSTPPYGYDKVKIKGDKGYTLTPNSEAPIVQMIFDLYVNKGLGPYAIATHLDSIGVKPRVNNHWSKSTIHDMLKNPVYIGKIRWSYKKEVKYVDDGKMRKKRSKGNPEDCILVDGLHEAIIDETIFNKANDILVSRRLAPVKKTVTLQNPLTGLIFCNKCGQMMTRMGPNKHLKFDTIRCPNKQCSNISSPIYMVEKLLLKHLTEEIHEYELNNIVDVPDSAESSIDAKKNILKDLNTELGKLEKQLSRAYDLLEQEVYDIPTFTARTAAINAKKESTLNSISTLEEEIKQEFETSRINSEILPVAKNVVLAYETVSDAKAKNDMLRQIIDKIYYEKDERNIRGQRENYNFTLDVKSKLPRK